MKSNVCEIKRGEQDLFNVLKEVEKVTVYNALPKREAIRLRLLAEELVGMLPELVKNFEGCFWLQNKENDYELHVELSVVGLSKEKKEELIAVSASKKNAAASGFMGKIRDIAENMLMRSEENDGLMAINQMDPEYVYDCQMLGMHYSYAWSLDYYVAQQGEREVGKETEWDQLEKSIVAKLADDVIVGVRGRKVEIVIKKTF